MVSFLFWNLNRQMRHETVARLAHLHRIDVLMLAECQIPMSTMLASLNDGPHGTYSPAMNPILTKEIALYTRLPVGSIKPLSDIPGLTIRHLVLPVGLDIVLAVAHLGSKLFESNADQAIECTRISRAIADAESRLGHSRTILVGDLNMDPFETGVVAAGGLHATSTRKVALRRTRIVKDAEYPMFYNPMWGRFGDCTPGPPGTYYHPGAKHTMYFWHMFDQVLVRPDLLHAFDDGHLEVLATDGCASLATDDGRPDPETASDHFPLRFELSL